MYLSLLSLLTAGAALASVTIAQVDPDLTGTWTTKSRKVLTGPVRVHSCVLQLRRQKRYSLCRKESTVADHYRQGFYDPINDKFLEPALTGFSYSFTDDGYYEVAYYRAISNRMFSRRLWQFSILTEHAL